jgi:hypothetical protein
LNSFDQATIIRSSMKVNTIRLTCCFALAVSTLLPGEENEGWLRLFDPVDRTSFQTKGNWQAEDGGVLHLVPRQGEQGWQRYDSYLWTTGDYADFICELEYKLEKDGNSGFYFRVADVTKPVETGVEVQILDCHGQGQLGWHDLGGIIKLTRIKDPAPLQNASRKPGEWNQLRVTLKDSKLTVVINGVTVQDQYDLAKNPPQGPGLAATGKIGIQDHGMPFWIRNVRIKRL